MILVTGAAGFIGSVLIGYLNQLGIDDIICVDDMVYDNQFKNLIGKRFYKLYSTNDDIRENIKTVIHLGANSNTLEKDWTSIYKTNVLSTRRWYEYCKNYNAKFIFSSSAAIYGNGQGPTNQYAFSKSISEQEMSDVVILRLFNVYGPNEYHKGRMASTVFHWYQQYRQTQNFKVFENSEQYIRDFIYVEDVAKVINYFIHNYYTGTYDLGTGNPISFEQLSDIFCENFKDADKNYIPMPLDLISQYQKFSCADTNLLKNTEFNISVLLNPVEGVKKYVEYLKNETYY